MKLLLVGHSCSPVRGSEPGFTWNWGWHLSMDHQVWVMAHPQYSGEVEQYLLEHPNPNLHVVWVRIDSRFDPYHPERGERGVRMHYLWWLRRAFEFSQKLHREVGFDLCHHVSLGAIVPPPFWRMPVPFVWGPIGGGQVTPSEFRAYFGRKWPLEYLRAAFIRCLPYVPRFRRAVRRCATVLVTNRETENVLRAAGATKVVLFGDSGVRELPPDGVASIGSAPGSLNLLWAGRLEGRKGLPLLLEAMTEVRDSGVRLVVAGDGPLRVDWETLAHRKELHGRVSFVGRIPHSDMQKLFRASDVFAFTSLRDSFGSVVMEAASYGLPVLTLNHQGVGALVPDAAAIKVSVKEPKATIAGLADGIRQLAQSPERRRRMAAAAREYARSELWRNRAQRMNKIYEAVLSADRDLRL